MLIGQEGVERLSKSKVAVFGLGGVGSYVCEALARSGVGNFILIDNDKVSITNINRQLIALKSTVGMQKTQIQKQRILDINDNANIDILNQFILQDTDFNFLSDVDYIVDAIDTISAKIALCVYAQNNDKRIIAAMGAGNKFDATKLTAADIYETSVCPLCKVMRRELRKREVKELKVVYSTEEVFKATIDSTEIVNNERDELNISKKSVPGSMIFVPSVMGIMIANQVVGDLLND